MKNDLVEIFAGSIIEAELVKSLLINYGIQAFLKDEIIGTIAPWQSSPGGVNSVKVVISNEDYAKALLVVQEYNNNLKTKG